MKKRLKEVEDNKAPDETQEPPKDFSKEDAKAAWEQKFKTFAKLKDSYEFVLTTRTQYFAKDSQVYITYGRLCNRESLKRYGFCNPLNKYNYLQIKLQLSSQDPHIQKRRFLISQLFSDVVSTEEQTVKEFKIFEQRFNTKILKFIKLLNCSVSKSMVSNVLESKSVALEYISLL